MNKNKILRELNFLNGYLMYLRVENPLFKPLCKKYHLLKKILKQQNKQNE